MRIDYGRHKRSPKQRIEKILKRLNKLQKTEPKKTAFVRESVARKTNLLMLQRS